jgi:hypothetical protein
MARYIVETQRRDGSWTNSIHAPIHKHFDAAKALADRLTDNESPLNPSRAVVYDPAIHYTSPPASRLEEQLQEARSRLQGCQRLIQAIRQRPELWTDPEAMHACAVQGFYAALDRAWEAQCMAQGSY